MDSVQTLPGQGKDQDYLRSRLMDLEKRHSNTLAEMMAQYEALMRGNVDKELRELSQRFSQEKAALESEVNNLKIRGRESDAKVAFLSNELDKCSRIINERNSEIDGLRARLGAMETEKNLALEDLRRRMIEERNREIEGRLTEVNQVFLRERSADQKEIKELKEAVNDLEVKIQLLINDNDKLSTINEQRLADIDALQQRIEATELEHQGELEMLTRNFEATLKSSVERERNDAAMMHAVEKGKLESQLRAVNQRLHEYEMLARRLESELINERTRCENKGRENDELLRHISALEANMRDATTEFKRNLELYRQAMIETRDLEVKFDAEKAAFETQLLQFRQKVRDQEVTVAQLSKERDEALAAAIERLKQVDGLKHEMVVKENMARKEAMELRSQIEELTRNGIDARELTIKYGSERAGYETQIKQLKQLNENSKVELQKLYELMNLRKREYDTNLKLNEDLRIEVQRVNTDNATLLDQLNTLRQKLELLVQTLEHVALERDTAKAIIEKNEYDLNRRNKELAEKLDNVETLKERYETLMQAAQRLSDEYASKLYAGK